MTSYEYKVFLRGNNTTALVMSLETDASKRKHIQDAIFKQDKSIEQVGFVHSTPDSAPALIMAGGEFCGNATRCAAWYYSEQKPSDGIELTLHIVDSLTNKLTEQKVKAGVDESLNAWTCIPELPNPLEQTIKKIDDELYWVDMESICHLIVLQKQSAINLIGSPVNECEVIGNAKTLLKKHELFDKGACGVMFVENALNLLKIHPCVFVNSAGTEVYETSCGSGSIAVALVSGYLSGQNITDLSLLQPSGKVLKTYIEIQSGRIVQAKISGSMANEVLVTPPAKRCVKIAEEFCSMQN